MDDVDSVDRTTYAPVGVVLPVDDMDWFWENRRGKKKRYNWVGNNPTKSRCNKVGRKDRRAAKKACPCAGCE